MSERYLYLIRHGQYFMDPNDARYGTLTRVGREQAAAVAKRLSRLPIDAIHHSDLPRAEETARVIARQFAHLQMKRARLLREGHPGISGDRWTEKCRAVRRRMERVAEKYCRPARDRDRHELLVCHGNLIRFLLVRVLSIRGGAWWKMDIFQGALSVIRIESREHHFVHVHNEATHLPARLRTLL
jgi:serine/threonine-protein phosphatase PGAM5